MPNAVKGEHKFTLEGVGDFNLRLSMGALAEIESALETKSISELMIKMANMNSTQIGGVMLALARAGGHTDLTMEDIAAWPPFVAAYTEAIRATLVAGSFIKDVNTPSVEGEKAPPKKAKSR